MNQFGSSRVSGANYTGIKTPDEQLIDKLRQKLAARGARGIIGLQRIFKILDDNNNGTLEIQEFWKGLCDFKLNVSEEECRRLFDLFDENDDGVVDFDELIRAIKGEMNPFRKQLIKKAFNRLDANGNGVIEVDDIKKAYNAENHPDVRSKKKTEMQVLSEFLETFEAHRKMSKGDAKSKKGDGVVTLSEFMDYYSNVSASIDNDDYF